VFTSDTIQIYKIFLPSSHISPLGIYMNQFRNLLPSQLAKYSLSSSASPPHHSIFVDIHTRSQILAVLFEKCGSAETWLITVAIGSNEILLSEDLTEMCQTSPVRRIQWSDSGNRADQTRRKLGSLKSAQKDHSIILECTDDSISQLIISSDFRRLKKSCRLKLEHSSKFSQESSNVTLTTESSRNSDKIWVLAQRREDQTLMCAVEYRSSVVSIVSTHLLLNEKAFAILIHSKTKPSRLELQLFPCINATTQKSKSDSSKGHSGPTL